MSQQILRRSSPAGAGFEAALAAVRSAGSAQVAITHPPNDVSYPS